MGDTKSGQGLFGMREENVALRIEYEMRQRGWSQERLAKEMADAGYPLHQSAISKIVNPRDGKRRTIGVDEAIGFARVFGTTIDSLTLPLAAARSDEVRRLIEEISKLLEQRLVVIEETSKRWQRLRKLLKDPDVIGQFIDSLQREGFSLDAAAQTLNYWIEGAFIKGEVLDAIHPDEVDGMDEILDHKIETLRKLRDWLASEDPSGILREFLATSSEEDVLESGLPLASRFLSLLSRKGHGEQVSKSEIDLAFHWIDLTIQSLIDLREDVVARRERDGEDVEAP